MVEIKDIVDRESLEAWLKTQPRRTSELISHRAAMRVLPVFWNWALSQKNKEEIDNCLLWTFWLSVVSEVIAYYPSPEIKMNLRSSADIALQSMPEGAGNAVAPAKFAIGSTGNAATYSSDFSIANGAAIGAKAVGYAASAAGVGFWSEIRTDCEVVNQRQESLRQKLWRNPSIIIQRHWLNQKNLLLIREADWGFLVRWYDAELDGETIGWKTLEFIAGFSVDDWMLGVKHISRLISDFENKVKKVNPDDLERLAEDRMLAATPLAEKVELNPETRRLRVVPERMSQKALYNIILEKIRDGMADLRDSSEFDNALSALAPVFEKVLDRTFEKYLSSPQRVHDDFIKAKRRIQKLLDIGEVAPNDEVIELVEDLDSGAAHIRANMPQVRESAAALAALRIAEASDADIEGLRAGAEAIADLSEPEMAAQMREDAAEIVASRDVPLGAPKVLVPDVTYRLAYRVVASKRILTRENVLKAGVVATGAFTGGQMISEAVKILLRLLGF